MAETTGWLVGVPKVTVTVSDQSPHVVLQALAR